MASVELDQYMASTGYVHFIIDDSSVKPMLVKVCVTTMRPQEQQAITSWQE